MYLGRDSRVWRVCNKCELALCRKAINLCLLFRSLACCHSTGGEGQEQSTTGLL